LGGVVRETLPKLFREETGIQLGGEDFNEARRTRATELVPRVHRTESDACLALAVNSSRIDVIR
jgi:hypothetical protein